MPSHVDACIRCRILTCQCLAHDIHACHLLLGPKSENPLVLPPTLLHAVGAAKPNMPPIFRKLKQTKKVPTKDADCRGARLQSSPAVFRAKKRC